MKLVAMMNNSQQYTEDQWESKPDLLEINEDTTIKELVEWQKRIFNRKPELTEKNFIQIHILGLGQSPKHV